MRSIASLLEDLKSIIEERTNKHQVLVDSKVVDLVPVLVHDVQTSLKPRTLIVGPALLTTMLELGQQISDLVAGFSLVYGLVTVPKHEEETFPEHTRVFLDICELNATFYQ